MRNKLKLSHITTIRDARIEPYFITKDDHCYTVNISITPDNLSKKNIIYVKPVGHYSSFGSCLKKIAIELTNQNVNYDSIDSYLDVFYEIENKIKTLINLGI